MANRGPLCVLVVLAACDPPPDPPMDADPGSLERVATFPATPRALDLMFVIDDSPSMADKQFALASTFPQLASRLEAFDGGLPDLHISVVSTDMGTSASANEMPGTSIGSIGQGGCAQRGKNGAFVVQPNVLRSTTTTNYLQRPRGGEPNYNGPLVDALRTQVKLGAGGCGFEQPLAAMKAALENPSNSGFVRPDASLAIVILSDEDDCSARNTTLFLPDTAALGPLQSFRCFRFGVECSPDTVTEVGTKTACRPRQSEDRLLDEVAPFHAAVLAAKGNDARKVMLAAIVAPADTVAVELRAPPNGGQSQLVIDHACEYPDTMGMDAVADPAVRLSAFIDEFEGLHVRETICSANLAPAAASIGGELERLIVGDRCLYRAVASTERCIVVDETADDPAVPIAKCGGGASTCWEIVPDGACSSGMRLDVARTQPAAPNTFTTLRCGT
ncbi:MAG: hypothetical protein ACKV2T_11805 [Kofleriaceae bacterium]